MKTIINTVKAINHKLKPMLCSPSQYKLPLKSYPIY